MALIVMQENIKIQIQDKEDRDNFIIALANNRYKPEVITEQDLMGNTFYYVVFELR